MVARGEHNTLVVLDTVFDIRFLAADRLDVNQLDPVAEVARFAVGEVALSDLEGSSQPGEDVPGGRTEVEGPAHCYGLSGGRPNGQADLIPLGGHESVTQVESKRGSAYGGNPRNSGDAGFRGPEARIGIAQIEIDKIAVHQPQAVVARRDLVQVFMGDLAFADLQVQGATGADVLIARALEPGSEYVDLEFAGR